MELTGPEQAALTIGADFFHTTGVPRLGVPAIVLTDGPHGVRRQRTDTGFSPNSRPATCFPTASALAATWDPSLIEEVGVALGEQARAQGVSVLLGPGANIKRTPLCGRDFEYFSEDPLLSARLAAAWITGVQRTGVGACLKHFAANNAEFRRYSVDSRVDERALREIYLASFEGAVRDAAPAAVMSAYNLLNGVHCSANVGLLTGILRGEWGFAGAVVSDWGGTADHPASLAAGLDLSMPGFGRGRSRRGGRSRPAPGAPGVARAAASVLRLTEATAAARAAAARTGGHYDADAHHALARRVAAAGTVLLRNSGPGAAEAGPLPLPPPLSPLLPLPATGTVAVLGAFAQVPRYQGAGSSLVNPHLVDDAYSFLAATLGDQLSYAPGYDRFEPTVDEELLAQAGRVAMAADVAVIFVGLPETFEVEGLDREHLDLPAAHNALVERVAAVHPRVVVVISAGAPVALPWAPQVGAILLGYLGGEASGAALADVLLGVAEPGGRLAETFPARWEDNPVHALPVGPRTTEYRESVYVGYRYYDSAGVAVRFPFGHGLSYTSVAWSAPSASASSVSVTLTNTGPRAGSEVVQVYVHDVESTVFRPSQELRGFAKVHLEPGASQVVTIPLSSRAFAFWDVTRHAWTVEAGTFEIRIGASSRDIRFTLPITVDAPPCAPEPGPPSYHHLTAATTFDEFPALYGAPLPSNEPEARGDYTLDTPISQLDHPVARLLLRVLRGGARRVVPTAPGDPTWKLVSATLDQATPRMLPMMSAGLLGDRAARFLLRLANRARSPRPRSLRAPISAGAGRAGANGAG